MFLVHMFATPPGIYLPIQYHKRIHTQIHLPKPIEIPPTTRTKKTPAAATLLARLSFNYLTVVVHCNFALFPPPKILPTTYIYIPVCRNRKKRH